MSLELIQTTVIVKLPVCQRARSRKTMRSLYRKYRELGLTQERAGLMAGYTPNSAKKNVYRVEKKVMQGISDEFDRVGLTDHVIARETARIALSAKRVQGCDVYIQDENGKWKINQNSSDFIDVDDEKTRLDALKLASVLKKHIKTNGNGSGSGPVSVMVTVKFPEEYQPDPSNRLPPIPEVETIKI